MPIIYALGIGHNTPVFLDLALDCGYEIGGLYHYNDTRTGEIDHGYEVLGSFEDLLSQKITGKQFLLTMGDMGIRRDLTDKIQSRGGILPSLIHPNAYISRWAEISKCGVLIFQMANIQADVKINANSVLLTQSNVAHSCEIGQFDFLSSKVSIGAYTTIEDNVFIGQGVTTISGKVNRIGAGSYIGARALITKPVPQNVVMCGFPAKILRTK